MKAEKTAFADFISMPWKDAPFTPTTWMRNLKGITSLEQEMLMISLIISNTDFVSSPEIKKIK